MRVLVFNCGSSSLKYRVLEMPHERELAGGEAQRVGPPTAEPSRIVHRVDGGEQIYPVAMPDQAAAFRAVMDILTEGRRVYPAAIGHRLVHGGTIFSGDARVDDDVLAKLESIQHLAPIHNPPATALVRACGEMYPQLPQVVVFDTAYHATIPSYAREYAIPPRLREELGVRKYGFHGTSHRYVVCEAARIMGKAVTSFNAVSCHLGSGGASLCAVVGGQSVDNTMGYSPLQGLVMSTRCGDLDPAVTLRLLAQRRGDVAAVSEMLNKQSGLLGMSGRSADIRDILDGVTGEDPAPDAQARNISEVYLWRIRKYLGAYLTVVGRADAVIFTDTIGEQVPEVRQAVCAGLDVFGVRLDPSRNAACDTLPADVATDHNSCRVLVIATNEELAIARAVHAMLGRNPSTAPPQKKGRACT